MLPLAGHADKQPEAREPPEAFKRGAVSDQLLAAIDITAQTVACAGINLPDWMHGRPFLTPDAQPRGEVFSAADWIGGSRLKSHSIRTDGYKYIRNFNTSISVHSASTEYRKAFHPMYHLLEVLAERGELSPLHQRLLLDPLPEEKLYDLNADPHELRNLASDPGFAERKADLRSRVERWIRESGDVGFEPLHPDHVAFFDDYKARNRKRYQPKYDELRKRVLEMVESEDE